MLAVFLAILASGVVIALCLKPLYSAHASVLIGVGPEYVYGSGAGAEREILASDALKERVIRKIGYGTFHTRDAQAFADADPEQRQEKLGQAVLALDRRLRITPAPDSPVIRLAFDDPDPAIAARVLNTLLDEYLIYRRSVWLDAGALAQQRRAFEDRLDQVDRAYLQFLSTHQIGDFEAEKTTLSQLQAQIEQQRYAAQVQIKERGARLAGVTRELGRLQPEVGLFRDIDNTAAKGQGIQRIGVNPVYQTLQTEQLQLSAEAAALTQALATLNQQTRELTQRRLRLAALEPQFQNLSRDRDALQSNVWDVVVKEQQSQALLDLPNAASGAVRIVQRASPPTRGQRLRALVLILTVLFAGFAALCAGLGRMVLRPGLPTPASAARALDLPILGAAAFKA